MSADCSEKSDNINKIFKSLSYGASPESDKVAEAWLESHKRKFGHFINNEFVFNEKNESYETKCPATGEILASTLQGSSDDVDKAVAAAKLAYKTWSQTTGHFRAKMLHSIARHLQIHAKLMAVVESLDNGKPIRESRDVDVNISVRHLYYHAGWASLMDTEFPNWTSLGVIGAIVPWNFPLMLLMWKVSPALAMGNVVVLKPATYTRLSALLFAEICAEAGLPPGVFNVVTGPGSIGSHLALHGDVAKVAFTGSTEVGQVLRRSLAGSGKKLSLELGGKSPVVVFETADLDSAVEGVVDAIWFNQGQVCSAGSRLLIQESVFEMFVDKLKARMKKLRVGHSLDKNTDMGAIIDPKHLETIKEFVREAVEDGADVFQACDTFPSSGCFYPPTLITGVQTVSKVVLEEIFGPVLVALPFRTTKEAIELANNTCYGLAASVWTEKIGVAFEVALSIRAGTIWINCHNMFDAAAGFGGYKMSGYGRDGGKEGLYEYIKQKWYATRPHSKERDRGNFASCFPGLPSSSEASLMESNILFRVDKTYKLYIGGKQQRPDSMYYRPIISDDGEVVAHAGEGSGKDVRNAVEAAHAAAAGWHKRTSYNKAQILYYIAENLQQRAGEFCELISTLNSKQEAELEVNKSIERLFYWAAYADKNGGRVQETTLHGTTVQVNEPNGVVGIVCPNKFPLLAFVSLVAPAIARSNCVVVVPSERFPMPALNMYQIFDTSDLPGGVVNIISGESDGLAKYLSEHRDVQSLWYFGSSRNASRVVEYESADNLKRTWVDDGLTRDWMSDVEGCGEEFLYHANQVKNIWVPMGDVFAN